MATVRVSPETRERLLKLQARMQLKTGRKVSMNDVIMGLLDKRTSSASEG